jgi:hypothetical protein
MKWRAFSRMPQWVRLSEWLGGSVFATLKYALVPDGEECGETAEVMMPEELAIAK